MTRDRFFFGESVMNECASIVNPNRYGHFVRYIHKRGRINPGNYVELTDGKGKFWMVEEGCVSSICHSDRRR